MPKDKIITFIDFFYPLFRRFMPEQTYRYAVCGSVNTLLGLAFFKFLLVKVFTNETVNFILLTLKSHNAALLLSFCLNFLVGFLLMKYVVFVDSNLKGRIQLVRYLVTFIFNLCLNYILLNKIFIEAFGWKPFFSQCTTTCIIVLISYLSQKYFSFKVKNETENTNL